jgi:hypothetical protein
MKRSKIRLSIVSAMVSVSLLGLPGFGAIHPLLDRSSAARTGVWCC